MRPADDGPPEIECREAIRRMYEYLDGELPEKWTERIRRHLEICRRCWPRFDFERAFLEHIRRHGTESGRSRELRARVHRLLSTER